MIPRLLTVCLAAVVPIAAASQDRGPSVCRHRAGRTVRFRPDRAKRAAAELVRSLSRSRVRPRAVPVALDDPFDARLPSCRRRTVRVFEGRFPRRLKGKELLWSREGGEADFVFRTRAGSLRRLIESGDLPGARPAAAKWGVRCVPSRVRILAVDRIEVREGVR